MQIGRDGELILVGFVWVESGGRSVAIAESSDAFPYLCSQRVLEEKEGELLHFECMKKAVQDQNLEVASDSSITFAIFLCFEDEF